MEQDIVKDRTVAEWILCAEDVTDNSVAVAYLQKALQQLKSRVVPQDRKKRGMAIYAIKGCSDSFRDRDLLFALEKLYIYYQEEERLLSPVVKALERSIAIRKAKGEG